jgi:hypothetical protein
VRAAALRQAATRIAIAIALIAPLGFLMGIPFPRGLQAFNRMSVTRIEAKAA